MINKTLSIVSIISFVFFGLTCDQNRNIENLDNAYLINLQEERDNRNWLMQYDATISPFFADTTIKFKPLNFYPPNKNFIFKSKLYKYENPDSVTIFGTNGQSRNYLRYGYFLLKLNEKQFKLNLYKITLPNGVEHFNLWFKDATNGIETYENGRYLFFTKNEDENFIYTIDFNKAINPLCAYSKLYVCPIPSSLDSIPVEVTAGEKKFL